MRLLFLGLHIFVYHLLWNYLCCLFIFFFVDFVFFFFDCYQVIWFLRPGCRRFCWPLSVQVFLVSVVCVFFMVLVLFAFFETWICIGSFVGFVVDIRI